jgi:hypothetical protein
MTIDQVQAHILKMQYLAKVRPDIAILVVDLVDKFLELTAPPMDGAVADVRGTHVPGQQ